MKGPVATIDGVLLGIYGRIARELGWRFGATPAGLSRGCVAPFVVFGMIRIGAVWWERPTISMAWLGGMIAAELFVAAWLWSEAELANSVPNLQAPYRVIWVIVSLPDFLFLAQHGPLRTASTFAEDIAVISAVYFASTPHTPKRRRRRARARFGLEARQGA